MVENQTKGNDSLLELGATSGAQKVGEGFASRALNAIVDGVKAKYEETQVLLGTSFSRYLENASQRYNQVTTLATGKKPRSIIGPNNIYVSIGVQCDEKKIDTDTVDSLLQLSKNIVILGTGGIGKSMLTRYLFLNTANRGEYIPILLELRRVSYQEEISIIDLVYSCMNEFDVELPREQFEYSLRLGKYLFLMDGFDEIKESKAMETAAAIQAFCAKYPKNPCIITSRPRRDISPLETFTAVESLPLSKEQAISLASKIWEKDEKTIEFCRQLETDLYDKHRDFAENPLLLTMMFLTFMRNNSVPNHLVEFYSKSYDALYSKHDSNDKGYYLREFKCEKLDESSFRLLLSHFCFQTYFRQVYEFTQEQALHYLEGCITKLGLKEVNSKDYMEDLCNVVCILVEDGGKYRFSHRSFQTYFAACYTANILTDEQQKKLFGTCLSGHEIYWTKEDYYHLLSQIEPQRFEVNALEDGLRSIRETAELNEKPHVHLLRMVYSGVGPSRHEDKSMLTYSVGSDVDASGNRYFNIIQIFGAIVLKGKYESVNNIPAGIEIIKNTIQKIASQGEKHRFYDLRFTTIDNSELLTAEEKEQFFDSIAKRVNCDKYYEEIMRWLDRLDDQRKVLTQSDFLDDL